jgi:alkyl hydroperoxide reductase subunit F
MYDLIIIGAGPAGTSAGVYAARKQLKTLLLTEEFGGQSTVSPEIYNWIGSTAISGNDLAKSFKEHLDFYTDKGYLEIESGSRVASVAQDGENFTVTTEAGDSFTTRTVFVAAGSSRRKITVPGAAEFENKGIVYCASCDGPLFSGQDVVVIGGGNAGFETAAQLAAYCKSVTILHRNDAYKADEITVKKVLAKDNVTGILNADTTEVLGDKFVTGMKYKDSTTGEEHHLDVTGVFVEIGQIPNSHVVDELVELDDYKRITIDPWTQETSIKGIWAAGDVTNVRFHQNNISAGDAVKAVEDIYLYLHAK